MVSPLALRALISEGEVRGPCELRVPFKAIEAIAAIFDSDLSHNETTVAIAFAMRASRADGVAWPSVADIVRRTKLGERTVRRAIAGLKRRRVLVSAGWTQTTPKYRLELRYLSRPATQAPPCLTGRSRPATQAPPPATQAPEPYTEPSEEPFTERVEIPAWLRPWLRKHRSRLGLADDLELVGGLSAVLEAVTGRIRAPTKTPSGPVLRLWSAMLDEPDAVGDALGVSLALDLADLVRLSVLLANAGRDCPASIFARDLRAEGWPDGTDRHRIPAAVCRLTPPPRSSGADYLRRLEVAHRWHEAGRPLASWPPEEEQRRRRSSSQQPRSIAERVAGSVGRSLLLLPGGIDESR